MGFLSAAFEAGGKMEANLAQASQARVNAHVADLAAADALHRGEQKVAQAMTAGLQRQSAQKVAYAHAGVDTSSGTPAAVISQTAMVTQLEALTQRNNAARQAFGYKVQASQLRDQANLYEEGADSAVLAGGIKSAAEIVALGAMLI